MIQNDNNLEALKLYIPQLLKRDLYKNRHFECCPCCGSVYFIKHGFFNGIQRYKCKGCHKTFSKSRNSLWYYSKKTSNLWVAFIELFLQKRTLRQCSGELDISLGTSFYWRHKVMNVLKSTHMCGINPSNLKGDVSISTAVFQETEYNTVINFNMDYYFQEKRIILCAAKGEDDSMVVVPIGRRFLLYKDFAEKIYNRIDRKSYIVAHRNKHLVGWADKHNRKYRNKKRKHNCDETRITQFYNNAKEWFLTFNGIRTKYLESYIAYFILFNLDRYFKSLEFTYLLFEKFNFIKTKDIKLIQLSI